LKQVDATSSRVLKQAAGSRFYSRLDMARGCSLALSAMDGTRESRNELDAMVVNIELTLVSIIQGVALTFLAENAREVLSEKQWSAVPYVVAGLLLILLFWSRSLIHTLTLIRWPLEFGHNFFYITCTLAEVLAFTRLTEPFWWFALNALFSALVWGLFIYDLRMIRMREADSRSDDALRLYKIVMRDQNLNIGLLVPLILVFNLACAFVIHTHPDFFLRHNGHLWLVGCQVVGLAIYLGYVIRAFVGITPLLTAARHDWRSGEDGAK
jgi:hypothetical protein